MYPVTHASLVEFLGFLRLPVDSDPGTVQLLCLQGCVPVGGTTTSIGTNNLKPVPNVAGMYNDTIILIGKDEQGNAEVDCLLGTIDPGTYYTVNDPHPAGAAHLTFGQHLYKRGLHQSKYPALRSVNETNRIWRDKNGNFKPDAGEAVYEGAFGTNVHAGGKSEEIGKNSAGCINICGGYSGAPYLRMLAVTARHEKTHGAIRVNLWSASDFVAFQTKKWALKPTLILGMEGPWVAEMQTWMTESGYSGTAITSDGDFGPKTHTSLIALQKAHGLVADGVCGPKTWAMLQAQ